MLTDEGFNSSAEEDATTDTETAPGPPTPKEPTIIIDPEGDLVIRVHTNNDLDSVEFLVSSPCIRLASPKWKALLAKMASRSPSRTGEKSNLLLNEHDITTLEMVLHCAHLRHPSSLQKMNYDAFIDTARFCDRHQTATFLRPLLDPVIKKWIDKIGKPGYEDAIMIPYAFKFPSAFAHATSWVASRMSRDKRNRWMTPGGDSLNEWLPLCLIGKSGFFHITFWGWSN